MSKSKKRQQAVGDGSHGLVIGGGIAGLLAARVLLNHFKSVTIVERELLPEQPATRPGVAQTVHSHGLLKLGSNILEQLFPGLEAELIAAGAILADEIADTLVDRMVRNSTFIYTLRFPWNIAKQICQRKIANYIRSIQTEKSSTSRSSS